MRYMCWLLAANSPKGRVDPVPFYVKNDLTGLGKTNQDVRMSMYITSFLCTAVFTFMQLRRRSRSAASLIPNARRRKRRNNGAQERYVICLATSLPC